MKQNMTFTNEETAFIDEEAYFNEHLPRYILQSSSYLLKTLHRLCRLSHHEISVRSGIGSSGVWHAEKGNGICTTATFSRLLYCYLHAQHYLFRPRHLARQIIQAMRQHKHMVIVLVDDEEMEQYSNRQKILIYRQKKNHM